jgi:hypothetical protein
MRWIGHVAHMGAMRNTYTFLVGELEGKKSIIVFWDITPCSPLKVNRRFGGTYRLHLQGRALLATCFHAGFLLGIFFDPEDGDDVHPKRRLTFNGLYGFISQKVVFFITTAVRTLNPTYLKERNHWGDQYVDGRMVFREELKRNRV